MTKSRRPLRLAALAILVGTLAAFAYWRSRPELPAVTLHAVAPGRVEVLVANTKAGSVQAIRRAKLAPDMAGRIAVLNAVRNQRVASGDVLVELWNQDLVAAEQLARAELAQATAHALETKLLAEVAERERARAADLGAAAITSEEHLDRVTTDAAVRRAAASEAEAAVQVATQRLRVQETALERTRLRAPFAGIVAEVNGELGEIVTPSPVGIPTPPTIDLIEEGRLRVSAPIDEVDVRLLRVGLPVRVTLDGWPGRVLRGELVRIAPYVTEREKEARTVDVEVHFAGDEDLALLRPGLSADVEAVVESRAEVLRVPAAALRTGDQVLVAREVGAHFELAARTLELGARNWQWAEVRAGLVAGELVVVAAERTDLAAGARVTAHEVPATAPERAAGAK